MTDAMDEIDDWHKVMVDRLTLVRKFVKEHVRDLVDPWPADVPYLLLCNGWHVVCGKVPDQKLYVYDSAYDPVKPRWQVGDSIELKWVLTRLVGI